MRKFQKLNWPVSRHFFLVLLALACRSIARAEAPLSDDQIVIYDMKEDPTVATFIGVPSVPGFYGLEVDEEKDEAVVFFKLHDIVYRAETDMKIKGNQMILKYRKNRKTFVLSTELSASGVPHQIVYPVECPPEKGGWRHGPSFGRHVINRGDEKGERIIVGSAHLEFELAMERCQDSSPDCGPSGCKEWDVAPSTAVVAAKTHGTAPPSASSMTVNVSLSKALLEAKLGEKDILTGYQNDIDTVLPPSLTNDVVAFNTGYRTSPLPYPAMNDPFTEQRGLKFGVIEKKYLLEDKISTMTVGVEPLSAEFQAPLPNKCGTWNSDTGRTLFDFRGQPALYEQTATGSSVYACGKTISISLQTQAPRTKEVLSAFLEDLPLDQIERLVGSGK